MAHRNQILELLDHYAPTSSEEMVARDRFIAFVMRNADCFLRSLEEGHVTGSCFLVYAQTREVLLTHHKKIGAWLQLGGHADGESDILRVALKEAEEESGIAHITPILSTPFDIDIHRIDAHKGVPSHLHYDVRFLLAAPHKNFMISDESNKLAWVEISDVAHDFSMGASIRRMAQKWLSYATRAPMAPKQDATM